MTKDQMQRERDRLQGLLEAYEARATAAALPDHHKGLRQRIENLEGKLAELELTPGGHKTGLR